MCTESRCLIEAAVSTVNRCQLLSHYPHGEWLLRMDGYLMRRSRRCEATEGDATVKGREDNDLQRR
jgi:hypothetical protein